ncbi:hypothetical protein M3617_28150, partial [Peribacillus frigoritolerans]|nr:hypothetical protein [Peribacillus frigoritolerans]
LGQVLALPAPVLAGLGFVAVFAGAANTPIASTIMAIELFGADIGVYVCDRRLCRRVSVFGTRWDLSRTACGGREGRAGGGGVTQGGSRGAKSFERGGPVRYPKYKNRLTDAQ